MDMKVDSSYIKAQRAQRAWSQEHLAEVSGLGLRTIQRIEKTGAASYESARSLAAVFEIDVAELRVKEPAAVEGGRDVRERGRAGVEVVNGRTVDAEILARQGEPVTAARGRGSHT